MKIKILKIIDNKTFKGSASFYTKHPKYGKYVTTYKKYLVHCNDSSELLVGSDVNIKETKPLSRRKRWIVVSST